jgi:CBS domain-containing protein
MKRRKEAQQQTAALSVFIRSRSREESMSLHSYCRKPVVRISPETNITEACRLMEQNNIGCLIAEREGKLCGIITDRDIALRVTGAKRDPDKTKIEDVMTPDPIRVSVDKDLHHLTALMHAYHVRRVPIVQGFDTTLGIVTLDDLIAQLGSNISEIGRAIFEEFPEAHA